MTIVFFTNYGSDRFQGEGCKFCNIYGAKIQNQGYSIQKTESPPGPCSFLDLVFRVKFDLARIEPVATVLQVKVPGTQTDARVDCFSA